jgi:hypothetical protein
VNIQGDLAFRRRSGWEASDTGTLLWQRNIPALLSFYGVPLGIAAAAGFFLPEDSTVYFSVLLWWCKPFFDRFALHVVSVRFFEPNARFRRLFKGLGKSLWRGLIGDLLWRRFSLYRSARMPLRVLEGSKGAVLKRRLSLMNPRGLYFGFPIMLMCLALSTLLTYGELAFIYGIFELIQPGFLGNIFDSPEFLGKFMLAGSWVNQIFIETLYVCMGFGIYINSRVETEGWDIELLFKRCTEKAPRSVSPAVKPSGSIVPAVVCLALASLVLPQRTFAASPELFVPPPVSEESARELENVLSSEDFGNEKPSWKIRLKNEWESNNSGFDNVDFEWRDWEVPWMKEALGIAIRTVIIAAAAFLVFRSALYFYRRRRLFLRRKSPDGGYGIQGEFEDPAALLEKAAALHAEGRIRDAWALCFRAFIASLSFRLGIVFSPETTEYEALALAGSKNSDFPRFVSRWIAVAYGGRKADKSEFDESIDACRRVLENPVDSAGGKTTAGKSSLPAKDRA